MTEAKKFTYGRFLLPVLLASVVLPFLACTKKEETVKNESVNNALRKETPPTPPSKTEGASGATPQAAPPSVKETEKKTLPDKETQPGEQCFKDNGDGTITDVKLGLMWVKDPSRSQS